MIGLKREMDRAILRIVPFGEENATTARLIWRQLDLGTIAGVKFKLNRMVEDGLLERKFHPTLSVKPSLYFRPAISASRVSRPTHSNELSISE